MDALRSSRAARMTRSIGPVAGAIALATALTLWRTWPLASMLGAGAPTLTYFDWIYTSWTLAWQVHAIAIGAPLAAANIYHPAPDALFYGPLCTGLLPLFAPVYWASGNALLAVEVAYLFAVMLTGVSVHLVVRAWTRSWAAGAVAVATLFACDGSIAMTAPAPQWAALAFFAPLVWALDRASTWRGAAIVALLATAQCLTEPVYVAPAVIGLVCAAGVLRLFATKTRPTGIRLLVAAAASVALLLPLVIGFLRVRLANPALAAQTLWPTTEYVASPTEVAAVWLQNLPQELPLRFLVPALAAVALIRAFDRSRATTVHAITWLDAGLLAVLPFALWLAAIALASVTGFETLPLLLRVPERLVLGGFIGVALVGGLAWHSIASAAAAHGGRLAIAAPIFGAALALLWHGLVLPPLALPIFPERGAQPTVAALLRTGSGPVLELPSDPWAMHRSLSHWRPLLNGYASFWPAGWDARMEDAARLPDGAALARLVQSTGLATVVVRVSQLPVAERARWKLPLEPRVAGLVLVAQEGDVLVFDVDAAAVRAAAGG